MAGILSQAEIDELLNALVVGRASESESEPEPESNFSGIKAYDFRTANKFPKEQIRTFNIVFQTFAQLFSNQMTSLLRTSCECELLSMEELSFNEFNNALSTPAILAILKMPPLHGSLMMELSPQVAYMAINRLLGGSVAGVERSKQFTEIELALVERVLRQAIHVIDDSWEKVIQLRAQVERLETSPQFAQIVPLNEPVVVVTLNLTVGAESGLINICIPHAAIEPVAKQLNTRMWYAGAAQEAEREKQTEQISEQLHGTPVVMTAYFEDTPATVDDIVRLRVGDVIRLSQRTDQPIMVKIQHIPKFYAQMGISGSHYAVQIVDIIKEGRTDESVTG